MAKEIIFQGVPVPGALSENPGSVFVEGIDRNENQQLQVAGKIVIPYDRSERIFIMPASQKLLKPSTGAYESQRTLDTFKMAAITAAGDSAIWTPTTGKRFRLMGFTFFIPSTATTAAGSVVKIKDGATDLMNIVSVGASTGVIAQTVNLPGNGYLSAAVDNVLNLNISGAFTAGGITITLWGCEE